MYHTLIAATVAVVSTVPSKDSDRVLFRDTKHVITFDQPVITHEVEMTDDNGCKISSGSAAEGATVTVRITACQANGIPPGHVNVKWTVNGASGEYQLHIGKHH